MRKLPWPRAFARCLYSLPGQSALAGASPHLADIEPAGVQRGAETDVTITGERLGTRAGCYFTDRGSRCFPSSPAMATGHAAAPCGGGLSAGGARCAGLDGERPSDLLPLYVGPFPNVACSGVEPHYRAGAGGSAELHGQRGHPRGGNRLLLDPAKKGDRLPPKWRGCGWGATFFDPWAAILDAHGQQLAANDDNSLLLQDPLVSIIAPTDGTYLVSVRESTWGGSDRSFYRLHIGTYPQPVAVYPARGRPGRQLPSLFWGMSRAP